ncbi:hypothetical protein GCM10027024_18170 [Microbacterium insulae]
METNDNTTNAVVAAPYNPGNPIPEVRLAKPGALIINTSALLTKLSSSAKVQPAVAPGDSYVRPGGSRLKREGKLARKRTVRRHVHEAAALSHLSESTRPELR